MKTFIPSKKNINKNFINEEEIDNKIINNITNYITQNNIITLKDLSIEYNKQLKNGENKIFNLSFEPFVQEEIGLSNFTLRKDVEEYIGKLKVNYNTVDISFMGFLPDILTFKIKIKKINNSFILVGSNYFALLYRYGYFYLLYKKRSNYSIIRISNKVSINNADITFVYYRDNFKKFKLLVNDKNIIINYHRVQNLFIEKDIRINGWFNNSNYCGDFELYKYEIYNYDTTL